MDTRTESLVAQIDRLLEKFPAVKDSWYSSSMGGHFKDTVGYEALITECYQLLAHLHRGAHPSAQRVINAMNSPSLHSVQQVEGILQGTRANLRAGFLDDLIGKIVVDIKSDFLEASQQLLDENQKDPAAVMACIVLEDSLKRLAKKHGVESAEDKEMSVVAGSLLGKGVIEKTTNQSIQSFKSLRNAALHAQWSEVSIESLRLLLVFLPGFIEKHEI
jgi:hypothetical protein